MKPKRQKAPRPQVDNWLPLAEYKAVTGQTQVELGKRLGVHQNRISQILRDKKKITYVCASNDDPNKLDSFTMSGLKGRKLRYPKTGQLSIVRT